MAPLRIALGLLAVLFAYFLGRSGVRVYQQQMAKSHAYTWALRTIVCVLAVFWGHGADLLAIVCVVLVLVSAAGGIYIERRPRKHDDLEHVMFPKDP